MGKTVTASNREDFINRQRKAYQIETKNKLSNSLSEEKIFIGKIWQKENGEIRNKTELNKNESQKGKRQGDKEDNPFDFLDIFWVF